MNKSKVIEMEIFLLMTHEMTHDTSDELWLRMGISKSGTVFDFFPEFQQLKTYL